MPRQSTIKEAEVIKVLRQVIVKYFPGTFSYKVNITPIHGMGFPDLIFIVEGQSLYIETKAPNKKPTELQVATLKSMANSGAVVFVIDCLPNNKNILRLFTPEMQLIGEIDTKQITKEQLQEIMKLKKCPQPLMSTEVVKEIQAPQGVPA